MKTIHVAASSEYDVCIGARLLESAGERIRAISGARSAVVISDDTVFPLYGERVLRALRDAGLRAVSFVFPHGERYKTLDTYAGIVNFLAQEQLSRTDVLLALGGGVVGDVTGFAAATYQRGMAFVQLPTTLLAAVDASVGGKTAVDLPQGKNLVGSFWQPALVLCDTDTLRTLPESTFRDGCAEVIKYGVLGSRELFDMLRARPIQEQTEDVIARCVDMKRTLVCEDEFDRGSRRLLNLGHSFGHAVEKLSGFSVSHGSAVAIGMCMAARAAAEKGFCSKATRDEIISLIRRYSLPTETTACAEDMLSVMLVDKKMSGGRLHLIVPEEIGRCRIEPVTPGELPGWLYAGGAK